MQGHTLGTMPYIPMDQDGRGTPPPVASLSPHHPPAKGLNSQKAEKCFDLKTNTHLDPPPDVPMSPLGPLPPPSLSQLPVDNFLGTPVRRAHSFYPRAGLFMDAAPTPGSRTKKKRMAPPRARANRKRTRARGQANALSLGSPIIMRRSRGVVLPRAPFSNPLTRTL